MKVEIAEKIKYIGVDDTTIDLFESQYLVPEGISYNSYVILDDVVAVMDTVDKRGQKEWEESLLAALEGRKVALIENGSWAPSAARTMRGILETMKDIEILEPTLTIRSVLKESDGSVLEQMAEVLTR